MRDKIRKTQNKIKALTSSQSKRAAKDPSTILKDMGKLKKTEKENREIERMRDEVI